MRGATYGSHDTSSKIKISTHAPLARRDHLRKQSKHARHDFYSRASCEARLPTTVASPFGVSFLLTRLLRGATTIPAALLKFYLFLLTRLLRGATTHYLSPHFQQPISTHTPLARRDEKLYFSRTSSGFLLTRLLRGATSCKYRRATYFKQFLLTRLLRGATPRPMMRSSAIRISTHAPLARRDPFLLTEWIPYTDFYSRASCEARLIAAVGGVFFPVFLLTRLLRGATPTPSPETPPQPISTHAPLARRDYYKCRKIHYLFHFYSRASCEARQYHRTSLYNLV